MSNKAESSEMQQHIHSTTYIHNNIYPNKQITRTLFLSPFQPIPFHMTTQSGVPITCCCIQYELRLFLPYWIHTEMSVWNLEYETQLCNWFVDHKQAASALVQHINLFNVILSVVVHSIQGKLEVACILLGIDLPYSGSEVILKH